MKYSNEQRYFCVEIYKQTKSFQKVQNEFEKKFNRISPAKSAIWKMVKKFNKNYSVDDNRLIKKKIRSKTKIHDENS